MKNDLAAYLFFFASDTDLENTLQEFFHIIKINSGDIKSGGEEDSWRVHIGVKYFLIEHILFHDLLISSTFEEFCRKYFKISREKEGVCK